MGRQSRRKGPIVVWAVVAALGAVAAAFARSLDVNDGLLGSIRYTARLAFPLFWLAWTASCWAARFPNPWTKAVLAHRAGLGVAFAVVHLLHLALIGLRAWHSRGESLAGRDWTELVGAMAYVFVIAMLVTSFPTLANRLSAKAWKRLHSVGGYWIAIVFTVSYGGRAVADPFFWPQAAMLVVGWILKATRSIGS